MKMDVINLGPEEQMGCSSLMPRGPRQKMRIWLYLNAHALEPKRQYWETKGGKEYLVYYFGHCYPRGIWRSWRPWLTTPTFQANKLTDRRCPAYGMGDIHGSADP